MTRVLVAVTHPAPWQSVRRVLAVEAGGECLAPAPVHIAGEPVRTVARGRRARPQDQRPACRVVVTVHEQLTAF